MSGSHLRRGLKQRTICGQVGARGLLGVSFKALELDDTGRFSREGLEEGEGSSLEEAEERRGDPPEWEAEWEQGGSEGN